MEVKISNNQQPESAGIKKTWSQPELEIISKDGIQSGTDNLWAEGTVPASYTAVYAS